MNYAPPYTISSKILKLSTKISEELEKLKFNASVKTTPMLRKKNRIKTLAGTLEIEGNFLGVEKITAIIEGKRVLATVSELAEVQGAIKAYEKLDEYKFDSMDDLLNAHKILMHEVLTTAGNFRTVNVQVGQHIAPQGNKVNDLMLQLFAWLENSDEHILLKSCIFHYEFEFIHPFSDGNGRIGRLWQSVILNSYNPLFSLLPTESIVRDHQEEYYKALEISTALGESTPFIEFMLEMILEAIYSTLKSNQKILTLIEEYDFKNAEQGKFYRPLEELEMPVYLDYEAIRILPMDKDGEFEGMDIENVQSDFFLKDLPNRKNENNLVEYRYQKQGIITDGKLTLILFQYENKIIACAILTKVIKFETPQDIYKGALYFNPTSIAIFNPIDNDEINDIFHCDIKFGQSKHKLSCKYGDDFFNKVKKVKYAIPQK